MRKVIFILGTFVGMMFTSCEKNSLEPDATVSNNSTSRIATGTNGGIYGTNLNDGLSSNCDNNILVFPSWEVYYETIEQLDLMVEQSITDFDVSIDAANVSDEVYDQKCEAEGFDEDNVLINFENQNKFCSLRKKISSEESQWLEQQGDGQWDMNADPDNHFIDNETERTLLNEQSQVAIVVKNEIVIFHFVNDEGTYVEIRNMDIAALQQINAGTIPQNNPNVVQSVKAPTPWQNLCKDNVTKVECHYVGDERLKQISKIRREEIGLKADSRIKSKTKGYKKKRNGGWAGARRTITAGISSQTLNIPGIAYNSCQNIRPQVNNVKNERKRSIKVLEKLPYHDGYLTQVLQYLTVRDNELYSHHRLGAIIVIDDFYDM